MAYALSDLRTLCKQALGNPSGTATSADAWWNARINSGYRRLTTYQGYVDPKHYKVVRFYELMTTTARALTTALTTNFVTPATTTNLFSVLDVQDRTTGYGMSRMSRKVALSLTPDLTGKPSRWCPWGQGGVKGYLLDRRPIAAAQEINVYEFTYHYPATLAADVDVPIVADEWHDSISYAATAEAARLLDMPNKQQEFDAKFLSSIAERRTPFEEGYQGLGGRAGRFAVGTY